MKSSATSQPLQKGQPVRLRQGPCLCSCLGSGIHAFLFKQEMRYISLTIQHVGNKKIGVQDFCSQCFFQRCDFQVPMLVFEGAGKDFTIAGFFQCSRWGFGSDHRVLKFLFWGNNGPVLCSLLATTASLLAGLPGIWSSRWGVKALKRPRIEAMVRANQAATSHENTQPDQCTELRRTYFEWWCSISLGQVLPGPGCVNFNIGIGACKQLLLSEESSDRGAIRAGRALW